MAVTHPVLLLYGPCDQQIKRLTIAQIQQGTTTCKGATYETWTFAETSEHPYVFAYQEPDRKPKAKGGNQNVAQAWSRWMHALGHKGPQAHRRVVKSTARINRIARKR